jgi:hypothetical protein
MAIGSVLFVGAVVAVGCGDDAPETATGTGGAGGDGTCNPASCPDDEGECRVPACLGEICGYMDRAEGSACSLGVCNAVGECVECVGPSDCGPGEMCQGNDCVPTLCDDGILDGDETDIDCGGPICPACTNGQSCDVAADCTSLWCDDGTCAACQAGDCAADEYCDEGICVDAKQNGDACADAFECASGFCADGVCCNMACGGVCVACDLGGSVGSCAPHADGTDPDDDCGTDSCNGAGLCRCDDGMKSGDESDVDCGGAVCGGCADGLACLDNGDCLNGACIGGVCEGPCNNGVLDPGETAIDCGGPSCLACNDGLACNVNGDCQSGVCDVVCQIPTCSDGVKNGSEPAVDCGIDCPSQCADNAACNVAGDCQSGVCTLMSCQPPTCTDLVENGSETDVDCGGAVCGACEVGGGCLVPQDCLSNSCVGNTCACAADLIPLDDGSGSNGAVGLPTLVMSEIDPGGYIELFNTTNNPIALGASTQWLCSPFAYEQLSTLAPSVTVPAHGYAVIPWPASFTGPGDAGGEVILYSSSSFGTSTHILDFVCWGTYTNSRKGQAESVGKWAGACDSALANGSIHRNIATTGTTASHYNTALAKSPMTCAP